MTREKVYGITILIIIGLLAIFFRSYNFSKSFSFAHDQDLYSWIARDILVNKHQRLVGQITSVDGVFIGSFYYYLMAAAYKIGGMNPLSAYPILIGISLFNLVSLVWIVNRHFRKKAAVVAAFIYAVSYGAARFDKWSVPTQPTLTWAIWMMGTIVELYRGNMKFLPVLGVLYGFIWQIHIALIPILPIPIAAALLSGGLRQRVNRKYIIQGLAVLALTMTPFIIFELKHNFSQIKSILAATKIETGAPTGMQKFYKVIDASGREIQQRLFFGWENIDTRLIWIILIAGSGYLFFKIDRGILVLMWMWIFLITAVQFLSKRVVSEYYFTNLLPIIVLFIAVLLGKTRWIFIGIILGGYFLINTGWLVQKSDEDIGYFYREKLAARLAEDAASRNFECAAVNYIADPGVGVGFRYLLWQKGIDLVKPGTPGVPVYNIVIPWQLSRDENPEHFGRFGLLIPGEAEYLPANCSKMEHQLEPMLGYTE